MPKKLTALALVACMSATGLVAAERTARAKADQPGMPTRNAAGGPGGSGTSERGGLRDDGIVWGECADQDAVAAGIRCGDVSVPADWQRLRGERVTIGVAKLAAKNPEERRGSLLVNLGSNGATARQLPAYTEELDELTRWYDVIAFDTRGLGTSSGVTCPTGPNYATLMFSLGQKTWHRFARDNREWAAECRQVAGPLAGNLDAWQVAHDMEAIRKALGEGGLNYFGNSYGAVLGRARISFPTRCTGCSWTARPTTPSAHRRD